MTPAPVCRICLEGWRIKSGERHCLFCGAPVASMAIKEDNRHQHGLFWEEPVPDKHVLYVYPDLLEAGAEISIRVVNEGSVDLTGFDGPVSWESNIS